MAVSSPSRDLSFYGRAYRDFIRIRIRTRTRSHDKNNTSLVQQTRELFDLRGTISSGPLTSSARSIGRPTKDRNFPCTCLSIYVKYHSCGQPHFLQVSGNSLPRTYPNISFLGVRDACRNGISRIRCGNSDVLRDSRSKIFCFRATFLYLFSPLKYPHYQQSPSEDGIGILPDQVSSDSDPIYLLVTRSLHPLRTKLDLYIPVNNKRHHGSIKDFGPWFRGTRGHGSSHGRTSRGQTAREHPDVCLRHQPGERGPITQRVPEADSQVLKCKGSRRQISKIPSTILGNAAFGHTDMWLGLVRK